MKRLTIFAKGNLDVRDTLHSLRIGGEVQWNGINTLLRERNSPLTIRIRHEPSIGSKVLADATGEIPEAFADRALPLDPYTPAVQFGRSVFDTAADVFVFSIQPDIQIAPLRHRQEGFLFYPNNFEQWGEADQAWLRRDFSPGRLPDADEAMANLETIVGQLRAVRDVPILIYNVSSAIPGETVHCYEGLDAAFSTRIRRFNLALVELSHRTGISIVDVDRVVATHGASALKLDTTHLTALGCRAVAAEVLRILEDCGTIPVMDESL